MKSQSDKLDNCSVEKIELMATNTWKALQPISRLNQQSYRFLSVLRERGKLTGSKHTRALTQNSKKGTEAGFQKNEFHQPGEHLYGNGLTITGK